MDIASLEGKVKRLSEASTNYDEKLRMARTYHNEEIAKLEAKGNKVEEQPG